MQHNLQGLDFAVMGELCPPLRIESSRSQWVTAKGSIYWIDISREPTDLEWTVFVVDAISREEILRDIVPDEVLALADAMIAICSLTGPDPE